jgi:hypothetical protein
MLQGLFQLPTAIEALSSTGWDSLNITAQRLEEYSMDYLVSWGLSCLDDKRKDDRATELFNRVSILPIFNSVTSP